jgi:hypothetical protein
MGKVSLLFALFGLLTAETPKPFGEVGDLEILVGQAIGGAAGYYLGAGAGFVGANAAGLLDVELCFAIGTATCPEKDNTAQGIAAAAVIFGTGALASTAAIYLVEQTSGDQPSFWWPLAAGMLASAGTVGATYGLYKAGVDAIEPGLVLCFITSVAAELITMRLLRPERSEDED